ncbi:MAG: ABC transporter permease [Acidimicrobiales bacterium]
MIGFFVRRIWQAVAVVIGVMIVTFILIHLEPGSPARAALGVRATGPAIAHFDKVNGLDLSMPQQFLVYVGHLIHGNLGYSFVQSASVASLIGEALPKDVILLGFSNIICLIVALPIGLYQGVKRNRFGDFALQGGAFILYAMPFFFLGFILIDIFAIRFPLLPPEAPQFTSPLAILAHPAGLVLPVLTLAGGSAAGYTQFMRSSTIDNLAQDYIRTAKAKGVPERHVRLRHLLPNSLIPIVTLLGLTLPGVVGGAIIVETVFNYPGMGLVFFQAALQHDYPVLMGFTLFVGVAVVVGNLLADIAYAALDPRIRLE